MLRISDQAAIRNPVHYLYTVANNLVKEHAVLDRRRAGGIDIDEVAAHEQLETLPAFDGELDAAQRPARLVARSSSCARNARRRWRCASRRDSPIGRRDAPGRVPPDGKEVRGAGARTLSTPHGAGIKL